MKEPHQHLSPEEKLSLFDSLLDTVFQVAAHDAQAMGEWHCLCPGQLVESDGWEDSHRTHSYGCPIRKARLDAERVEALLASHRDVERTA